MHRIRGALAALLVVVATAVLVLALAILPFLNPVWVGFEQGRSQAGAWTGFAPADLEAVTGSVLHDLVLGPPDFAVTLNGIPVLNEREREHMRDVRRVFIGLYMLAGAGLLVLVVSAAMARNRAARQVLWRRLARAGTAIAAVTVVGGGAAMLFFDAAFEVFHELFFPAGTYLFDPRTERLVQLFPEQFWVESTISVGVVIVVLAVVLRLVGGRAARGTA